MKLLDKLVLKDLVPQFFIGVAMFASLYFALGPLLAASRFLSQGFPPALIVKYMALNILPILGLTFPMGMLLAVLLGYGRLSADSETVALFAGGIPFLRVAVPAAVLGLAVSGAGYVINDPVAAYANHEILGLKENIFKQPGAASKSFDRAIYSKNALQATIHVEGGLDASAGALREVTIVLYDAGGRPSQTLYAPSAHPLNNDLSSKEWQLDDVNVNSLSNDLNTLPSRLYSRHLSTNKIQVEALAKTLNLSPLLARIQGDPNAFPFSQLRGFIGKLKTGGFGRDPDVRFAEVSLWNKIALPLASLVFALVGAPLALRPQRSSKMTGWILALPIILVYYILYTVMSSLARGGVCPPMLAAFLPDIVGLLVGIGLVWRRSVS